MIDEAGIGGEVELRNRVEKLKESDFILFFLFMIPATSFFGQNILSLPLDLLEYYDACP